MLWIFLAIVCGIGAIAITVLRSSHTASISRRAIDRYGDDKEKVQAVVDQNAFPVPGAVNKILYMAIIGFVGLGTFNSVFFYAEPGYVYHVRTIVGQEKMVDDVGYNMHLFGRINAWKKSMSIVAKAQYEGVNEDSTEAEGDNKNMTSSILGPVRTIFLDQVD